MVGPGPNPGLQGCPAAMRGGAAAGRSSLPVPSARCLGCSHMATRRTKGLHPSEGGVGGRRCLFLRRGSEHTTDICVSRQWGPVVG